MEVQEIVGLLVVSALVFMAVFFKPFRKTVGLLLVILGAVASFSFFGIVIGIPMIIVGGLLLFI